MISLVSISLVSTLEKKDNPKEQKNPEKNTYTNIPLLQNITKIQNINQSLIENRNISSSLNTSIYSSNLSIESIIDWYSQSENRENWTIKRSGLTAENENKPSEITFGYVKLKNEDMGLYVFCIKQENETIIGTSIGNYNEIELI